MTLPSISTRATTLDAYELFHKGVLALARAERNGLRVDLEYCEKTSKHLTRQINRLEAKLFDSELVKIWRGIYGKNFKLGSGPQLSNILYNQLNIEPPKYTAKDNPSVDEEALEVISEKYPEIQYLLDIRSLTKIRDTYLANFIKEQVDGILHPIFNLHLVITFRSSCDSPNVQNIPQRDELAKKYCRRAIKARKGHKLLCVDFKGIEVGIAACYHKDPTMISYVSDKSKDMHRDMAAKIYKIALDEVTKKIRHSGKNKFVFPEFYGDYFKNLAPVLWALSDSPSHNLPDGSSLREHLISKGLRNYQMFERHLEGIEKWFWKEQFPEYTAWKDEHVNEYQKTGYFDTLTGFRCSGVMKRNEAINYPVQGSAFHCLLQCLVWLDEIMLEEGWDSFIAGQIHDEIIIDVHPDEEEKVIKTIRYLMTEKLPQHWKWIIVPLEVEMEATPVDGSWYEKKEI